MAKEFAIITTSSGFTDVGTISTIESSEKANHTVGRDSSGNVDSESFNQVEREVTADLELSTRASIPGMQDTITVPHADGLGGTDDMKVREVKISESNSGEANTVQITATHHYPT